MIVDTMRNEVQNIMEKIHGHEFNLSLSQGKLAKDLFMFYLVQDALYLADFSKALALTAARMTTTNYQQQFLQFALDAINAESELHHSYFKEYQVTTGAAEQSPACFMYTHYLLKMASLASIEEAVASLLPCFMVYREVGVRMLENLKPNNPYHNWISLYSSKSFELAVESAIMITNELAQAAHSTIHEKMIAAFVKSTQLEWMFWESAQMQEQWLIIK